MDAASTLISVDTDPTVQAVARQALGDDPRLTLVLEDGAAFLRRQLALSPTPQFHLIFADAMPGKYESLDQALARSEPGDEGNKGREAALTGIEMVRLLRSGPLSS